MNELEEGAALVYDLRRQAWFPDEGQALEGDWTCRGTLLKAATYETVVGLRTRDAEIEVTERV